MSFDWLEYHTLAQELEARINTGRNQIDITVSDMAISRAMISRAYYACFITARNTIAVVFNDEAYLEQKTDPHTHVPNYYRRFGDGGVTLADKILELKGLRRAADYDNYIKDIVKSRNMAMSKASFILGKLKVLAEKHKKP